MWIVYWAIQMKCQDLLVEDSDSDVMPSAAVVFGILGVIRFFIMFQWNKT